MEVIHDVSGTIANIIQQLQRKSPEIQILVGAGVGFSSALFSIKVMKTLAFLAGGSMLLSSMLTEIRWNPEMNFTFNIERLTNLAQSNSYLGTGFIGGYLLGFSYS